MKRINILNSFKSKKFKYGGYATLMTAIVLAVLVAVNLVADMIPWRLDLTGNKMFSLSEQTYSIIEAIDDDITIYMVTEPGKENPSIEEIVRRYVNTSRRITLEFMDHVRDPLTAQRYTTDNQDLRQGSLIVESGDRFRVISPFELINYDYSNPQAGPQAESLAVEQRLTAAILYVTVDEVPVIYQLEGHGERELPYNVVKQLENENYEVKKINLLTNDEIPEDAAMLVVNAPVRDISSDEEEIIRTYLEEEGRAIFIMDVIGEELPNFSELLQTYGVGLEPAIIVEEDSDFYTRGNPLWLTPAMEDHPITDPIKSAQMGIFIPGAQGVKELDIKRRSIEIEPLLTTSNSAWGRSTSSNVMNMEKQADDIDGPFNVAVSVTDRTWEDNQELVTKLVVVSSANADMFNVQNEGNINFILNSANWLYDREESIAIRPKSLRVQPLNINYTQYRVYSALTVIVIPVLILGFGVFIWLRRRHL